MTVTYCVRWIAVVRRRGQLYLPSDQCRKPSVSGSSVSYWAGEASWLEAHTCSTRVSTCLIQGFTSLWLGQSCQVWVQVWFYWFHHLTHSFRLLMSWLAIWMTRTWLGVEQYLLDSLSNWVESWSTPSQTCKMFQIAVIHYSITNFINMYICIRKSSMRTYIRILGKLY